MQTEADPLCQPAASLYAEYEARQTLASQAHELSREDLRRTWSMVDILTSLKRNTSHSPTAALIRRKLDALPLPALDKLGCLVDLTILQRHGHHLSIGHYHGFQLAISSFPDDTATEIARAHSCREVISAAAIEAARFDFSHVLRLGIESITTAQKRGIPLHPIATDRHVQAMTILQEGKQDNEAAALEALGIEDAVVLEGKFLASSRGLLTGAAFCLAVLEELEHTASICCGRCERVVDVAGLSICRRCGDQLVCKACGRGCGWRVRPRARNREGHGAVAAPEPTRKRTARGRGAARRKRWDGTDAHLQHRVAAHAVEPVGIDLALLRGCRCRRVLAPSGRLLGRAGRGRAGVHPRARRRRLVRSDTCRVCSCRKAAHQPCARGTNPTPEREAAPPKGKEGGREAST